MKRLVGTAVCAAVLIAGAAMAQDISGEALSAHNALRAKHGVPALSWSGKLAATAQDWANRCVFEHSSNGLGENLAMGTSGAYSASDFVRQWYDEISAYDFANGAFSAETGHFTQVVWKSTTQVGCAVARCADGNDLMVCNYSPAGNMQGAFQENVPPPQ